MSETYNAHKEKKQEDKEETNNIVIKNGRKYKLTIIEGDNGIIYATYTQIEE